MAIYIRNIQNISTVISQETIRPQNTPLKFQQKSLPGRKSEWTYFSENIAFNSNKFYNKNEWQIIESKNHNFITKCSSLIVAARIEHFIRSSLERRGFLWLTWYSLWSAEAKEGAQSRAWMQELKQRPWRNAAHWLPSSGLLGYSCSQGPPAQV